MRKKLLFILCMGMVLSLKAQSEYSICGGNLASNGTFDNAENNSTSIPGWTFSPPGNEHGWKKATSLIYGAYAIINRIGEYSASPQNLTLKPGGAKLVKFRFNTSGTGPFTYTVSLGSQKLATFKENAGWAQAYMTVEPGIEATLNREYLSEKRFDINNVDGTTTTSPKVVANNIWHEVMLYVPNYKGGQGTLQFTYDRKSGILRQVMLSNVEVYEVIPKPQIDTKEYTVGENNKFNLASVTITNRAGYGVKWYNADNTPVANPSEAPAGSYYAVFTSNGCEGPKTYINIFGKGCGANIIKNGSFENPVLSDKRNGGKTVMNNAYKVTSIPDWSFTPGEYTAISVGNYYGSNSVLGLDSENGTVGRLSQNIKVCNGKYRLSFNLIMMDAFYSFIGGANRNIIFKIGEEELFKIGVKNRGGSRRSVAVHSVNGNIASNFKINGAPYTPSTNDLPNKDVVITEYNDAPALNVQEKYLLEVDLNLKDIFGEKDFSIEVNQGAIPYFGNFSLVSLGVEAAQPRVVGASVDCNTGVYDLKEAEPSTSGFRYAWYYDQNMTKPILEENGKINVTPGDYYMQTISDCSGCKSEATRFTVNSSGCAKITGTVYSDYDGADNGINSGKPFSGGLYAVLLNDGYNVVSSQKITPDGSETGAGTYTMYAPSARGYRVILSNKKPNKGDAGSRLDIGGAYVYTGVSVNNSLRKVTSNDNNITEVEPAFSLRNNQTATVDFGINVKPIAGEVGQRFCYSEGVTTYDVPALAGVDDEENFNNGVGHILVINSVSTTSGGRLLYNGVDITSNIGRKEIPNYQPSKLKYKVADTSKEYKLEISYKWKDNAGAQSGEPALATVTVAAKLAGTLSAERTIIKDCAKQKVKITLTGKNGASPYTFTYTANGVEKTATTNSGEDAVTLTLEENTTTGTHTFKLTEVKDYMECQAEVNAKEVNVFVNCNGGKVKCFKAPAQGETTHPTLVGISTLQSGSDWVNKSKNGFIKMESKNKGFVITRLTNPQINAVKNPIEGMLVWSTTDNCLKMYTDNAWSCLSQGCNE